MWTNGLSVLVSVVVAGPDRGQIVVRSANLPN
jgi:hypothetical protein